MDFPKSIESETDRRKVHELASRSMGVRRRVRERIKNMHVVKMLICQCRVFTHFKFQGRELLFKKKMLADSLSGRACQLSLLEIFIN